MPYRFRPWQLAAALIAVCAIVVGAVIWFRQSRRLTSSELLGSLPPGQGVLLFVNTAELRDAGVLDALFGKTVNEEAEYRDFVAQTGFDYKADLDQVLAKVTEDGSYFVVNGRFDWNRLMQYAVRSGGNCHNGFCKVQGSQPQRQISFYPIRTRVMALGVARSDDAARNIVLRSGSAKAEFPSDPLWLMASGESVRNYSRLPEGTLQFARVFSKADSVLLKFGPNRDGFLAGVEVGCKNAEDAAILKTQLEELTGIIKKMIAQESKAASPGDLSGVLTQGTFERKNSLVIGRWPISRTFLDILSDKPYGPFDMPQPVR